MSLTFYKYDPLRSKRKKQKKKTTNKQTSTKYAFAIRSKI